MDGQGGIEDWPTICVEAAGAPAAPMPEVEAFYGECVRELDRATLPCLLAGTYALAAYTGIQRPTKDLDIFCRAGDFPRILRRFQELGFGVEIEDERWLGKIRRGAIFCDVIFASANGTMPVNDEWFAHARRIEVFGTAMRIVSPTELAWSKMFIQLRHRFDGADLMHLFLKQHAEIDWRRLLRHMENNWEVLLAHLVNFRWIYPSERDCIPRWLMDELTQRLHLQLELPAAQIRTCRGRMFSSFDYQVDVEQWGFVDFGSVGARRDE